MFILIRILGLFLVALPLFYWEVPKTWSYLVFINIFALAVCLLSYLNKIDVNFKKNKINVVLIFFIACAILASILGADFIKSVVGNYYRFDGLVTLVQLVGFAFIFGSVYKQKWNNLLALSIYLSGVISSIWNNFGQINFLVGFILTTLPFGLYVFKNSKNKFLKVFLIIAFLFQIKTILTASSFLGVLGLLIIFPIFVMLEYRKYIKYLLIPTILALTLTVFFWYKNISNHLEFVAESRLRIYRNVFVGALKQPLLGYGWSNTDYVFESVVWPIKFNNDVYVDKSHMLILDVFSNTGIIGLTLYLYFIYLVFKQLFKVNTTWSKILILSLIMHLLYAQTNVTSISEEFIFWIIVGATLSL